MMKLKTNNTLTNKPKKKDQKNKDRIEKKKSMTNCNEGPN